MKIMSQAGDTIVEALFAIAIISLVLTAAYITANNSQNTLRDAQERDQAITLAQSEAEILNAISPQPITAHDFCLSPSNQAVLRKPQCSGMGTDNLYSVTISNVSSSRCRSPNLETYKVQVSWPSLQGGTDYVYMYYQPPNFICP